MQGCKLHFTHQTLWYSDESDDKMKTITVPATFRADRMIPSGGGRGGERKRTRRPEEEEDPNFPHIPEEIVFDLLSRLPGKSRSRFKCVSKRWRSLIASRQKEKLLVLSGDSLHRSVDRQGTVEPIAEPWQRNVSPDRTRFVQILGSCDGLVLIRIDYDLFLWNPATRYFEKVASHYAMKDSSRCAASGLCYDSSAEEYKAVLALEGVWAQTVEVGSLRSKCWTEVRLSFAKCWLNPGPTLNGHLHWFASKKFGNWKRGLGSIILEFNPQKNTFAKVPMPQPYGKKTIILGLGALEGCLCMARLDNPSNLGGNVEVLVMKGFGVGKTWSAMFTVSSSTGFNGVDELVPLYFMTNGEVLVKTHPQRIIKAYKANEVRDRGIQILHNCIDAVQYEEGCIDAVQYEESLVEPIGYNNWEEEELGGKVTHVEYINRISHQRSTLVSYGNLEEFFEEEWFFFLAK